MAFLADLEQNVESAQVRRVLHRNMQETAAHAAIQDLEAAIEIYRRRYGEPPQSLDQLVSTGTIAAIPKDPLGGRFLLSNDVSVRSSTGRRVGQAHVSAIRERAMAGKKGAELTGD